MDQTETTIILVVMSGSGVSLPFAQSTSQIGAILQQFYPGEEGEQICDFDNLSFVNSFLSIFILS